MAGSENRRVVRKLFMVLLLASSVVAVGSAGLKDAQANLCCSVCEPNYNNCEFHCATDPQPSACDILCSRHLDNCNNTCNPSC